MTWSIAGKPWISRMGRVLVGLFLGTQLLVAAPPGIALKRGTYVAAGTPCKDAPFAAIKTWDGIGFGGAHSSKCTALVTRRVGNAVTINDVCTALGDGTPAAPDSETATVTVLGPRTFRYARSLHARTEAAVYRWCARQ